MGILPVSVPFAALIESSLFPPLSLRREREREREREQIFLRYYHTTTEQERRREGRVGKKSGTPIFNVGGYINALLPPGLQTNILPLSLIASCNEKSSVAGKM